MMTREQKEQHDRMLYGELGPPLGSPFTRQIKTPEKRRLEIEKRREILEFIIANPGVSRDAVAEVLGVSVMRVYRALRDSGAKKDASGCYDASTIRLTRGKP